MYFIFNQLKNRKKEFILLFICSFIYLSSFFILEKIHFHSYYYTETFIDQYIPFIDIFVIPYLLWFVYIGFGFLYFLIYDNEGFLRTTFYIFIGMYVCLIIYVLFPSAQNLRVDLNDQNIFQKLLSIVYTTDTSTNVCPSIHTYNSIMMHISLMKSKRISNNKKLKITSLILTILICLSTVFTKQHAFMDVLYAIPLCGIIYYLEKSISYTKYLNLNFWKKKLLKA